MKLFNLLTICLAVVLGLFGLTGCQDDIYTPEMPGADQGELVLKYTVDGEMPLARSVAAMNHESTIKRVHVMFFDTEQEDLFVAYKAVAVTPGKGTFSIDAPENLELDRPYRVLAIGNGDTFAPEGYSSMSNFLSSFSGSYNDALGAVKIHHSGTFTRTNPGELPMFGHFLDKTGGESTFTVTLDGDQKKVKETESASFLFSRGVCRFDIHNLVGHILDIRYARVINNPDGGYLFADGLVGGNIPEMTPTSAPSGEGYMAVTEDMEPGVNTTQRLEGSLYGFPNIVNTTVVNDSRTTALMIAGYYIDPDTGVKDTELTYYRFNLANLGESQVLNRNYCYRATVKGVKRRGAPDEKEAYNDASPIFVYDVNPTWNTDDDNVVSDKDGNFLIVNQTHLTFQGDANEADFVELHVSTNPELTWEVTWVAETGNANTKFTFEKLSNSAVKCGPTEKNDTKYVRYGYLQIVATNPQTGKTLSMPIYLMQLSTEQNVKTLTVNGNTGSFTQELNPMGGTINLPVVTGSVENMWCVEDDGNLLSNWDSQGVSFTTRGGNNNDLVITVPANISGQDRAATLIVSLEKNETNADGSKKVPDVIINLTQKKSPQLMDIINFPSSGTLDIECLDLSVGNANGVVNQKSFIVRLTDSRYRYRVTTNFDKNRDLVLSKDVHRGLGSSNPAYAYQKMDSNDQPLVATNDKIEGCVGGTQFWINPFRTGPGDPMIIGNVTVTAYNPDDPSAPTEERSFTVRLKSQSVEIGDVILKNEDVYYLVPDRNYGTPCRISESEEIITATYADWRPWVKVTGSFVTPSENSSFYGTKTSAGRAYNYEAKQWTPAQETVKSQFINDNSRNGWPYNTTSGWIYPYGGYLSTWNNYLRVSKERLFFISEFEHNGKLRACWLHNVLPHDDRYGVVYQGQVNVSHPAYASKEDGYNSYGDFMRLLLNSKNTSLTTANGSVKPIQFAQANIFGATGYSLLLYGPVRLVRPFSTAEFEKATADWNLTPR